MEKDSGSEVNMEGVRGFVKDIHERNEMKYTEDLILREESACVTVVSRVTESIEAAVGNPCAIRAHSQLKLAESSLYWAGQYKVAGEWARAAEQISFARVQLRSAEGELGWGKQWEGNT